MLKSTTGAQKTIEGYTAAHGTVDFMTNNTASQLGDPAKAAANIIAFVADPKRTQLPLRFVVGDDAFDSLKAFYTQQLADMEVAKPLSVGTNYA